MKAVALTIAGSDPSGGAGIQADLKTFHQFNTYGEAVVTLLTVQNTQSVERVQVLDPAFVQAQIEAVLADIPPHAAKLGALGDTAIIEMLAALAPRLPCPVVIDPVMFSKHGTALLAPVAQEAMARLLLPHAALLTPNLAEAEALTGRTLETVAAMKDAARQLAGEGARAVLIKGGHLAGSPTDVLLAEGELRELPGERIDTRHTHGTGCTYSAAITAGLAHGKSLWEAVTTAKRFITAAIRTNPGLGQGNGPVNHHAPWRS